MPSEPHKWTLPEYALEALRWVFSCLRKKKLKLLHFFVDSYDLSDFIATKSEEETQLDTIDAF